MAVYIFGKKYKVCGTPATGDEIKYQQVKKITVAKPNFKKSYDLTKIKRGGKYTKFECCNICYSLKHTKLSQTQKLVYLELLTTIKANSGLPYDKRRSVKIPSNGNCFVCGNNAYYRHHIIMLINGGFSAAWNTVNICPSCHEAIHPWIATPPKHLEQDYHNTVK